MHSVFVCFECMSIEPAVCMYVSMSMYVDIAVLCTRCSCAVSVCRSMSIEPSVCVCMYVCMYVCMCMFDFVVGGYSCAVHSVLMCCECVSEHVD